MPACRSWYEHADTERAAEQGEGADQGPWEAQCVLLLWLSQLVLIPFDLALVDSSSSPSPQPGCAP